MLNLVIKDIVIQKRMFLYAFLYVIFSSITFSSMKPNGIGLFVLSPSIVIYLLITYAALYDDKNKSEIVLNSLPIRRGEIVIAKYISIFVFAIIGTVFSIITGLLGKTTGLSMFTMSISLLDIVLILMSGCIFGSIYFPLYFKFGYTKMKIFMFMIFMAMFMLPIFAVEYVIKNPNATLVLKFNYFINHTSNFTQNSLVLIIGLIIFFVSLMISIRIYENREF